jgi:hypothetical protein
VLVAPAALAHSIFGPDLRVEGQSLTNSVALNLVLTPSYKTAKPGVVVTMTNCKSGQKAPIRLIRRIGALGPGRTLQSRPGRLVWTLDTVPAKPAKPKLQLRLAIPAVAADKFCVHTSMYDNFTKRTVDITTRVPL